LRLRSKRLSGLLRCVRGPACVLTRRVGKGRGVLDAGGAVVGLLVWLGTVGRKGGVAPRGGRVPVRGPPPSWGG